MSCQITNFISNIRFSVSNGAGTLRTAKAFSDINSENAFRNETSDIIDQTFLLSCFECTKNSNTEDSNATFSLLTDVLEILGPKNNIIRKAIELLRVFTILFISEQEVFFNLLQGLINLSSLAFLLLFSSFIRFSVVSLPFCFVLIPLVWCLIQITAYLISSVNMINMILSHFFVSL